MENREISKVGKRERDRVTASFIIIMQTNFQVNVGALGM